jgi:ABC-type multidrug transport system fused ATPase/permease subunit
VLNGGVLVAQGTHDDLIRTNALYRGLAAQLADDSGIDGN